MEFFLKSSCCVLIIALFHADFTACHSVGSSFTRHGRKSEKTILEPTGTTATTSEPAELYAFEVALRGRKYELVCIHEGTPLTPIVWSKNGKRVRPSDRAREDNHGTALVIEDVDYDDQATYTCDRESNGSEPARSHTIILDVHSAPNIANDPEPVHANLGETVWLQCYAIGFPRPAIEWTRHGRVIGKEGELKLKDLRQEDVGKYSCNGTNPYGSAYQDFYVNVPAVGAEILQPPTDVASVDGNEWLRDGDELIGGRHEVLETGDLRIHEVRLSDAGEYTCEAGNRFGGSSASARLAVKNRTAIVDPPEDYEAAAGETAVFRCNALADSTLPLRIDWLSKGEPIDFESEPRFILSTDNSLITKTTELDSGTYTCVASTNLDEVRAQAILVFRDVPNPPTLVGVTCSSNEAKVTWAPPSDNRSPILRYSVQYNASFTLGTWETAKDHIPAADQSSSIKLFPWANYTFRVIAWNEVGASEPSLHSSVCTTLPDVPYKNPENVEGKGDDPQSLVIKWTVMPRIEHNAPKFAYRVYYKRDIPGLKWTKEDIHDWRTNQLRVNNQPIYVRYKIMVGAINERGGTWEPPQVIIGYSGEIEPTEAPGNFTLEEIRSSTTALLSWTTVPEETVRGELRGYVIETWTDEDDEDSYGKFNVEGADKTYALVDIFVPNSRNYVKIQAYNGRYNGPPSKIISFETPKGRTH